MSQRFYEDDYADDLWNFAEELANQPTTDDPQADATDRMTVALYRISATLASRMDSTAKGIEFLAETLRDSTLHVKQDDD
jgi:hypothetical protein